MDKKTVEEMLKTASREDLTDIITKLTKHSSKADQVVLDWCKKNNFRCRDQAIEMELQNLWDGAQEIISEFNQYGGGPDSDEEKAADALWQMTEIVEDHEISWDIRVAILDGMIKSFWKQSFRICSMVLIMWKWQNIMKSMANVKKPGISYGKD